MYVQAHPRLLRSVLTGSLQECVAVIEQLLHPATAEKYSYLLWASDSRLILRHAWAKKQLDARLSVSEFFHQPNKQKPVWHHRAANTRVYLPKMNNQLKEVCFVIKDLILQSGFKTWHYASTLSVPAGLRHEFRVSLMTSTHLRSKSWLF